MPNWLFRWVFGWIELAVGAVEILSLGLYRPKWLSGFTLWDIRRRFRKEDNNA